jgi:hypothetical protein
VNGSQKSETVAAIRQDSRPTEASSARRTWRDSKWLAAGEFLLVALIFYADHRGLIFFSKTPELLLLGWISLRLRGLRWRSVGLTRYRSWPLTIAIGGVLGLLTEAFQLLITQPILARRMCASEWQLASRRLLKHRLSSNHPDHLLLCHSR